MKNNELWYKLKTSVGRKGLIDISNSDYGNDANEHHKALLKIYETDTLPKELRWVPREVIELVRWDDYNESDKANITVVLFCTFLLLEALKTDENTDILEGQNQNIVIAINCAELLGNNWLHLLNSYLKKLYTCINLDSIEEEAIYFSLGISILCLLENDNKSFIYWAKQTADNIENLEKSGFSNYDKGILGYTCFDQKNDLWNMYLNRYSRNFKKSPLNQVLTDKVRLCEARATI